MDKNVVRLHNNFVESVYSLSLEAKKILLVVILNLNENNQIMINRNDMIDAINIDLRKVKNLKDIFKELMTKIIEIRSLEDKNHWELYQLLMNTKYKNGILTTSVYPELLPYFKEAKERLFTKFNIQNIKPLTSVHAIRIYELCKQFDDTGWRELSIDDLKKKLKLENRYSRIFDLRKRVLEVAKKQINKNTDININYELKKSGRKYTKIRFTIVKKIKNQKQKPLFENHQSASDRFKVFKNQKIYIDNRAFFIHDLQKNNDIKDANYNKYILILKDKMTDNPDHIFKAQLQNVDIDAAIDTVEKMLLDSK